MKKQNSTYTAFIPKTKKAAKRAFNKMRSKSTVFLVKSKKKITHGIKWLDTVSAKKIRSFTKRKSRKSL